MIIIRSKNYLTNDFYIASMWSILEFINNSAEYHPECKGQSEDFIKGFDCAIEAMRKAIISNYTD